MEKHTNRGISQNFLEPGLSSRSHGVIFFEGTERLTSSEEGDRGWELLPSGHIAALLIRGIGVNIEVGSIQKIMIVVELLLVVSVGSEEFEEETSYLLTAG